MSVHDDNGTAEKRIALPFNSTRSSAVVSATMNPATMDVMKGVQEVARAAVVDFDRPDVVEKLSAEAVLAMGLVAEEVVLARLKSTASLID